jgi:hypothetical protein
MRKLANLASLKASAGHLAGGTEQCHQNLDTVDGILRSHRRENLIS